MTFPSHPGIYLPHENAFFVTCLSCPSPWRRPLERINLGCTCVFQIVEQHVLFFSYLYKFNFTRSVNWRRTINLLFLFINFFLRCCLPSTSPITNRKDVGICGEIVLPDRTNLLPRTIERQFSNQARHLHQFVTLLGHWYTNSQKKTEMAERGRHRCGFNRDRDRNALVLGFFHLGVTASVFITRAGGDERIKKKKIIEVNIC